jgi:hypothetical protein
VKPFLPFKRLRSAIIFIAAHALFSWANGQNVIKNTDSEDPQACIPTHQFVPLQAATVGTQTDAYGKTTVALGSYERFSPDGRFVLRSFSGGRLGDVSLVELSATGQVVNTYETPLSNEAFPVQGSWRYIVDTNGDHYQFASLSRSLNKGSSPIKPLFRAGMTGFYAAAAELPSTKPGHVRIRSLSWPNANGSAESQGEGALVARTVEVDTMRHQVTADSGFTSLCTQRVREDGPLYALPMISVDGEEFAALPQNPVQGQPTMRVFGFGVDGKSCQPRAAFDFSSGKTIFGYAPAAAPAAVDSGASVRAGAAKGASITSATGQGADLAYEYRAQVWWYHRGAGMGEGRRFNIAPYYNNPRTQLLASAFPGITRDGRVMYGATLKDCGADTPAGQAAQPCIERVGYVVTDPFQSNDYQQFLRQHRGPARRQCITHGDVARVRAAFAALHGLASP